MKEITSREGGQRCFRIYFEPVLEQGHLPQHRGVGRQVASLTEKRFT